MRSRILVVGRDVTLRARLARMLNAAGYGVELAEGAMQARRIGCRDLALAIVTTSEPRRGQEGLIEELRTTVGKTLVVSASAGRPARGDVLDAADEAGLLARIAEVAPPTPAAEADPAVLEFAGIVWILPGAV